MRTILTYYHPAQTDAGVWTVIETTRLYANDTDHRLHRCKLIEVGMKTRDEAEAIVKIRRQGG